MSFQVNEKVVCVNAEWNRPVSPLVHGKVYVVARVFINSARPTWGPGAGKNKEVHLDLAGVVHPHSHHWGDQAGFHHSRFRKLRDISQSLRELKELAINCPSLEPVGRSGGARGW